MRTAFDVLAKVGNHARPVIIGCLLLLVVSGILPDVVAGILPPTELASVIYSDDDTTNTVHHSAAYLQWLADHPGEPLPQAVTNVTYTVTATFPPNIAYDGFLESSTNLTNWTIVVGFIYPHGGTNISYVAPANLPCLFFRTHIVFFPPNE